MDQRRYESVDNGDMGNEVISDLAGRFILCLPCILLLAWGMRDLLVKRSERRGFEVTTRQFTGES